ncbi:MAG: DUF5615 family PIN-like protein [Alphaproteobacteria bacterium]|nr:DUF5615 family PIN-like protein [Alphaproteobacteria bacterium]
MRFLIDAQLPLALCDWLREKGHDAQHVADVGLLAADDGEIWQHACENNLVLLTKDEDFLTIQLADEMGTAVCWLRIGNASNPALLEWMDKVFAKMLSALEAGERLIEVR